MTRTRSRTSAVIFSGAGLAAVLAGCSPVDGVDQPATSEPAEPSTDEQNGPAGAISSPDATTDGTAAGDYSDGSYSATGEYRSPNGNESVSVELTLEDGIVTAVTVTPTTSSPTSQQFQTLFAGGIADEVVGESIDGLNVSRVAGSSLTSGGFNDAIEQIKADAAL